jgi:PadR family transcriptional regulator PadR
MIVACLRKSEPKKLDALDTLATDASSMKISRELLKGSITLLVLQLLQKRAMYGYEIIQEARRRSKYAFELNEGTLYPALHQLEDQGSLKSEWVTGDNGRRRRYYSLTAKGRARSAKEEEGWDSFTSIINLILRKSQT